MVSPEKLQFTQEANCVTIVSLRVNYRLPDNNCEVVHLIKILQYHCLHLYIIYRLQTHSIICSSYFREMSQLVRTDNRLCYTYTDPRFHHPDSRFIMPLDDPPQTRTRMSNSKSIPNLQAPATCWVVNRFDPADVMPPEMTYFENRYSEKVPTVSVF